MALINTRGARAPVPHSDWIRQLMDRPRWLHDPKDDEMFFDEEWSPAVDIQEDEKAYLVEADIPGVDPKNIDITLENGVFTIRGERKEERKEEKGNFHRMERFTGMFSRRFTLPDIANADGVEAEMANGVLKVRIPKRETAVSHRIKIKT